MVSYRIAAVAGLVAAVYSIPLNINLGAYSPALVVGDGEISFGGNQDVTNLMNALEGAAVNAAAGQAGNAGARQNPAVQQPAVQQPAATQVAAATAASAQQTTVAATGNTLQDQAATISTLQGMGKEIAPREPATTDAPKAKRDLAGFDRALQFAENALTKGPVVQLGTGEGGAGVGIIVDNRPAAAAGGAARAGAAAPVVAPAVGKRQESTQPRRRTKVTTMYVRRGVPASLQDSSNLAARDVKPVVIPATFVKRDGSSDEKRDTIDAINLNVEDPQGITMTFVETSDEDDEQ